MTRVDAETFAGKDTVRVYIAARVREALRVEQRLSVLGIDYVVEIEPYQTRLLGLLPVEYRGATFYVLADCAESCRRALVEAGLSTGLVDESS